MRLRPYSDDDAPAVQRLLEVVWDGDEGALEYFTVRPPDRQWVAEQDGLVLGMASLASSALHPTRRYIGLHVHPDQQCRGIGGLLWNALAATASDTLQTATYATQTDAVRFLAARGFAQTVRTDLPVLHLADLNWAEFAAAEQLVLAAGHDLISLDGWRRTLR